jgi:hypothetical protein
MGVFWGRGDDQGGHISLKRNGYANLTTNSTVQMFVFPASEQALSLYFTYCSLMMVFSGCHDGGSFADVSRSGQ